MTSAVLDVAVCLLLVAAAVVTVADARRRATVETERPDDHVADGTLAVVTTATLAVTVPGPPGRPDASERRRGTAAELLSLALVAGGAPLRRAVRSAVADLLPPRTALRVYRPERRGDGLRVGPRPPPGTVHAATARLPARGGDGQVGLVVRWWP